MGLFDDKFNSIDVKYLLNHGYRKSDKYNNIYFKALNTHGLRFGNMKTYHNIGIVIWINKEIVEVKILETSSSLEFLNYGDDLLGITVLKFYSNVIDIFSLEAIEDLFSKDEYSKDEWFELINDFQI